MASIKPDTSKAHDLGSADKKWGTVHTGALATETITATGDVTIQGDLTVTGSNIVASVETVEAKDPLISLAKDNTADTFDIGFYGKSVNGGDSKYHGIVRDADDSGKFKVFKDAALEPTTAVGAHSVATVVADLEVPAGSELNLPMSDGTLADYVTAVTLGSVKANKVLTADANKDLDGLRHLTMTGTLTAGNVTIAGSSITVDGGAPNFDSVDINGGSIDGTVIGAEVSAAITASSLVVGGNVDLGASATDTLTVTAKVDSDFLPTGSVDLGSSTDKWAESHVVAASVETLTASGNVDLGASSTDLLTVNASLDSDLVPEADGTRSLGSSTHRWAHVHTDNLTANSLTAGRVVFAGVDGKLVDDADLSFSGSTLTATNVSATAIDTTSLAGFTLTGPANLSSQDLSNLKMISGTIDGATIETSDINITVGKTLDVTAGTLTTTPAQKLAILQGLADDADPDLGNNTLTAEQFISDVATGTAPFQVASTTKVDNLNADLLDGADWANPAHLGSAAPAPVTASSLTSTGNMLVQGDLTLSGEDGALTFDAASSVKIADAQLSSLVIEQADVAYMTFNTQDAKISLHKNLDASGLVLTAATFAGNATSAAQWDDQTTIVVGGTYFTGSASIDGSESTPVALDLSINETSIENSKLVHSSMDIAGQTVALGGEITAASIAAAVDGESMAITALTDLDATVAADLTVFDTLNAGQTLTLGHETGVIAIPGKLALTGEMTDNLSLASGKKYQIADTDVLTSTTLGSAVVKSSLTAVGQLTEGSIASGFGAISTANTIATSANFALVGDFDSNTQSGSKLLIGGDGTNFNLHSSGTDLVYQAGTSLGGSHKFQSVYGDEIVSISLKELGIKIASPSGQLVIDDSTVLTKDTLGSTVLSSSLTSVSALDSGSITSGFGSIDVGASQIQTSGTVSAGIVSVDSLRLDGATIGHSDDLDLMTLSSGTLTVAGRLKADTVMIGSVDLTCTAPELNVLDGDTVATATTIVDADRIVLNDDGTMVQVAVTDLAAYLDDEITSMPNLVSASALATVGSITQGTWRANDVEVSHGGTGVSSLTDHGVVLGSGTDPVSVTAPGTDGQILVGGTNVDPAFATLDAANGLSATVGPNTLQLHLDLKANGGCIFESTQLCLDLSASSITGTLAIADGGTGATTNAQARTNLGVAIGSNVQAWASDLDTLSSMQSGASTAAAALTAAEFAYLDKAAAVGVAEASKALVLDADSSITSGLSTLTASTITDGTASLSAGFLIDLEQLIVNDIRIDENVIQSLNGQNLVLNSFGTDKIIDMQDNVRVQGNVEVIGHLQTGAVVYDVASYSTNSDFNTNNHYIKFTATASPTLPSTANEGCEFVLINATDSDITLSADTAAGDILYDNGSSVTNTTLIARTVSTFVRIAGAWYSK